jgi:hypothetical protein
MYYVESLSLFYETYAPLWVSLLRKGINRICLFGTYRAPATKEIRVRPGDMGYTIYRSHG